MIFSAAIFNPEIFFTSEPLFSKIWEQPMDTSDIVDYYINCSYILVGNEVVSTFSLNLPAESLLLGLQLGSGIRVATINGNVIKLWLSFSNLNIVTPVVLPIEVTIITSSVPSRRKKRTMLIKVDEL